MARISAYHRPATVPAALALLGRPGLVPIGGGTRTTTGPGSDPIEVVDLQALGLDGIEPAGAGTLRIGATTCLEQIVESGAVPPVVRDAARREAPSTLRNLSTVAGCIAGRDATSELLAALLVHDAEVMFIAGDGEHRLALPAVLEQRRMRQGWIITAVVIETEGRAATARVGRTVADRPIVAACARRGPDGRVRLALTGVAPTPILVGDVGALDPPADFRGSGEYRRAVAATLSARVQEAIR